MELNKLIESMDAVTSMNESAEAFDDIMQDAAELLDNKYGVKDAQSILSTLKQNEQDFRIDLLGEMTMEELAKAYIDCPIDSDELDEEIRRLMEQAIMAGLRMSMYKLEDIIGG